jgi:hypothetical protein
VLTTAARTPPGKPGHIGRDGIWAIRLFALTGMRRDEVRDLRWECVDWRQRMLRLTDSKTGKRDVVVSDEVMDLLGTIGQAKGNPRRGLVVCSKSWRRWLEACVSRCDWCSEHRVVTECRAGLHRRGGAARPRGVDERLWSSHAERLWYLAPMLKSPKGAILMMTEERFQEVQYDLGVKGAFTEVVPLSRFSGPRNALVAIIVGAKVVAAAAFHATGHRVTELRRVRIHSLVKLNLPLGKVLESLPVRSPAQPDRIMDVIYRSGGFLSKEAWPDFWNAIRSLTTGKRALDALEQIVFHAEDEMETRTAEVHRLERDAIGLASEIAGFNRAAILGQLPLAAPRVPSSAIQTLAQGASIEDTFISYDARRFPNFDRIIHDDPHGVVTLSNKKGEALHILNVNRTATETATGVDLVYFAESFSSAVLIQYKLFNYGDNLDRKSNKAYYRLQASDDDQCRKMQKVQQMLHAPDERRLLDYRIGAESVFYKLCHRCAPDSQADLVPGIYFSVEHWERLLGDPISTGVRGAPRAIGYENSDRHLNNTEFTSLVRSGWIGSRATPPERLQQIIDELLAEKKSVTVAYKQNAAKRTPPSGACSPKSRPKKGKGDAAAVPEAGTEPEGAALQMFDLEPVPKARPR